MNTPHGITSFLADPNYGLGAQAKVSTDPNQQRGKSNTYPDLGFKGLASTPALANASNNNVIRMQN